MSEKRLALVVILSVLLICLSVAPVAAVQQWPPDRPIVTPDTATGLTMITPGDTVAVQEDAVAYDLTGLRNQTTNTPITELRMYEGDMVEGDPVHTIDVGADSNFALGADDLEGNYGVYYPYSGEDDAVIEENAIMLQEAGTAITSVDNVTPGETPTDNATPGVTPMDTMTPTTTPMDTVTPTTAPMDTVTPGMTPADTVTPGMTPADTVTPGMTPAETIPAGTTPATIAPAETPAEPSPTPTPLSLASVLGALGVMGLLVLIRKKR